MTKAGSGNASVNASRLPSVSLPNISGTQAPTATTPTIVPKNITDEPVCEAITNGAIMPANTSRRRLAEGVPTPAERGGELFEMIHSHCWEASRPAWADRTAAPAWHGASQAETCPCEAGGLNLVRLIALELRTRRMRHPQQLGLGHDRQPHLSAAATFEPFAWPRAVSDPPSRPTVPPPELPARQVSDQTDRWAVACHERIILTRGQLCSGGLVHLLAGCQLFASWFTSQQRMFSDMVFTFV